MVEIKKIGEVAEVKGGKRLPKGSALVATRNNHPYLRIVDFSNGSIDASNLQYVPSKVFPQIARYIISSNDIYISIVGTVGLVGTVPEYLDGASLTENAAKICNLSNNVNQKYLAYYLQSNAGQAAIQSQTVGSTQPKLALFRIKDIEFPAPPISQQISIASVLGALDDKIENNRRMNETLEEMARAIFKSWFVDFDTVHAKAAGKAPAHMDAETAALFPSSFGDDGLPVGWEWQKLGDCVSLTKGRSYKSSELQESDTALVSLKSFMRGGGYRPDGLKAYTGIYKEEQTLTSGDLIVALTDVTQAADVIGKPAIVRSNNQFKTLVASLDVGVVRPTVSSVSKAFLYCMMMTHDFQAHIYGHTSGTTVLHLGKAGVPTYEFGMPACEVLDKFTAIAQPIFSKIEMNEVNSITLAELRNTLLPKLMSGEIRVKDAERAVEAAV